MNPVERFANAQEELARTQVAADERLTVLLVLVGVGVALALIMVGLQVLLLAYRQNERAEFRGQFTRLERRNDEVWALLQIVKEWTSSARAHTKDAAETVKAAKLVTPEAEREVLKAVADVPEKTGEIVKKLMDDSDPALRAARDRAERRAAELD